MSRFKEIIVAAVIPMVKSVGKEELSNVLANIKEHNTPELYENTLKSIHSSFSLLNEVANKTKTKIDDCVVDLVLEAVAEAAEDDGITL